MSRCCVLCPQKICGSLPSCRYLWHENEGWVYGHLHNHDRILCNTRRLYHHLILMTMVANVTTSRHLDILESRRLDGSTDRCVIFDWTFFYVTFAYPPTQTRPPSTSPHKLQNKNVGCFSFSLLDCLFDHTNLQERAPFLFRGLQLRSSLAILRRLHLATNAPGYRPGHPPSARKRRIRKH